MSVVLLQMVTKCSTLMAQAETNLNTSCVQVSVERKWESKSMWEGGHDSYMRDA